MTHRRRRPRRRARHAAREPDPLPHHRRRRRRRHAVRQGRVHGHRAAAAHGPALAAALPELRRPFELPVVVQNQTDAADDRRRRGARVERDAHRRRRAARARCPRTTASRCCSRPPPPSRAPRASRSGPSSGRWADAAEIALPVWTPATTEAFATYGQIDAGAVRQPIQAPRDVVPQFGGLEVTTSSTALSALTDAVLYLVAYPFECAEQVASRVLAIAALKDVLTAFQAKGLPPPDELKAAVDRDVDVPRARCRTTTAGSRSGAAATRPGRTSASTSRTRSSARRTRASPCPSPLLAARAGLPARHRAPHPARVRARDPAHDRRLRALRARA